MEALIRGRVFTFDPALPAGPGDGVITGDWDCERDDLLVDPNPGMGTGAGEAFIAEGITRFPDRGSYTGGGCSRG